MNRTIPKNIHYCWFGGSKLPESAKKCIDSWKKYCPDYEIIEWNESNYGFEGCDYVKEAYEARKWAFVSDYARFDILYRYGGLYFDTDVELIKSIDDIVETGPFMGCEKATKAGNGGNVVAVAAGLGLGAYSEMGIYRYILEDYQSSHFSSDGLQQTVVDRITAIMTRYGFIPNNQLQKIEEIDIYPSEYFCPIDNMTGIISITDNTRSIHHYDASWMNKSGKISIAINRKTAGKGPAIETAGVMLAIPFRFINMVKTNGIKKTFEHLHSDI